MPYDGTLLILQDTTELDYSGLKSLKDELGQIGNGGGRGYKCHNSLAVMAESREVLGLANQILFCRPRVSLARLGSHQNRKHDHPPGWLVLWRGWMQLQAMFEGALAMEGVRCG